MNYLLLAVVGFLLFSGIRKFIVRVFPKWDKQKNLISGVLSLALAPVFVYGTLCVFFNLILYEYHPERKFDVKRWNEHVQERHQMRKSLVDSKALMNLSKNEVVKIIGLPMDQLDVTTDTLSRWRYDMGSRGWGLGLKFYYLDLQFKNGKSTQLKVEEFID